MVGTTALKQRVDENDAVSLRELKKVGVPAGEPKRRAALGDLQNRGIVRTIASKDAAHKDTKLQNALRGTKARVDTHWKKTNSGEVVAPTTASTTAATAAERKIITRSNSLRLGGTSTTAGGGVGLQRNAAASLLLGQKPKTLATKVVENKINQVKAVNKTIKTDADKKQATAAEPASGLNNLSGKSLTKLKAPTTQSGTVKSSSAKNSAAPAVLAPKKEIVGKENAADKLRIVSVQTHSSKLLDQVKNIDADDADNLILVSEYVNDIYNYLFKLESEQPIRENHLSDQEEVYARMRAVLIDWINEVHLQFHLAAETFQLAVAIIDRYLQAVKDTKRSHLQLVGITALFIAAKYEELFPPAIADFVYITDDTYTTKQMRQMELKIFKALDYNLSRPLPIHFLRRFSKAAYADDSHHAMSKYFLELAMIEYELASFKPSEIAAASLFLSLHLLNDNAKVGSGFKNSHWTPTLEWYSRYTPEHLRPITKKIAVIARNAPNAKLKAVYTKFQSSKFQKVSMRTELYGALIDSIINSKD